MSFLYACAVSIFVFAVLLGQTASADSKTLKLYHDADWYNNIESSESIRRGVQIALSEIDFQVQGYQLEFVKKNHSANVVRSLKNLKEFVQDEQALVLISGIHSGPLIKHRDFINENKILTLVPWAAGGPITRYPSKENWVFRVSVDDTKAGGVLVRYAMDVKKCQSPHLLLENTAWGQSNLQSMTSALQQLNIKTVKTTRFDWNLKRHSAQSILESIHDQQSDCILLVSNVVEGAEIAQVMSSLPKAQRVPIISHWGITGANFHKVVDADIRKEIDLSFIQSCFSFLKEPLSEKGQLVYQRAQGLFADIESPKDIRSPAGFIHAYDMTQLLIQALKQITLTDNIIQNREALRVALENLNQPVPGLIKTYQQPFSEFTSANPDAHEALGANDLCMARYGKHDEIILVNQ